MGEVIFDDVLDMGSLLIQWALVDGWNVMLFLSMSPVGDVEVLTYLMGSEGLSAAVPIGTPQSPWSWAIEWARSLVAVGPVDLEYLRGWSPSGPDDPSNIPF